MTPQEERIDKALGSLSHARTALDDPSGLSEEDFRSWEEGEHNEYVIDQIDDAMRLLSPEKSEQKFALIVALDGEFVTRHFDAEEEAIEAIGEAISVKLRQPDAVVTLVLGRVEP
jgi:hypothetical protein